MTPDEKISLLRAIFKEFSATGNPQILLKSLTDDVVYKISIGPGTPLSGEFRGREGVAELQS